jgi:midasin
VVQFLSHVLKQKLHIVNCHATTETSDLLGGLRPVRGRHVIAREILVKLKTLLSLWPHQNLLERIEMPAFLFKHKSEEGMSIDESDTAGIGEQQLEASDVSKLLSLARAVFKARPVQGEMDAREVKRRKLTPDGQHEASDGEVDESFKSLVDDIEELGRRYNSLFEWSDGPLVHAMKTGDMMLLDEMSLAEDAVLERLNSVLEPSRTLVLAEKGESGLRGSEIGSSVIVAHNGFRIFATMNPGGDFGKRELSPALRSRFTEIWVPPVSHRADFELVLSRNLVPRNFEEKSPTSAVLESILSYVDWFNTNICGDPSSQYSGHSLSLRDVLSWARFIVEARVANEDLGIWEAYCHGACLMHLDGLGLGSGLALEDASTVRREAQEFLVGRIPKGTSVSNLGGAEESLKVNASNRFGAFPFFIPTGALPIRNMAFNLEAPTTAQNMFRVLRAMQVRKPVLLEGSPGVGKTRYESLAIVFDTRCVLNAHFPLLQHF